MTKYLISVELRVEFASDFMRKFLDLEWVVNVQRVETLGILGQEKSIQILVPDSATTWETIEDPTDAQIKYYSELLHTEVP